MIPERDPDDSTRARRARRWFGYLLVLAGVAVAVLNVVSRTSATPTARELVDIAVPPLIILAIGAYFVSSDPADR